MAVNVSVWLIWSDPPLVGDKETLTGIKLIVTVAVLVESAVLVATSVNICWDGTERGAVYVYTPLLNDPVPAAGEFQVTD